MRQIGLALDMYAQSYDEMMPPYQDAIYDFGNPDPATRKRADGPWRPNYLWCLQPYLKNQQIQACPSVTTNEGGQEVTPRKAVTAAARYGGQGGPRR